MYYKLEILYDDLSCLVKYFEDEDEAQEFVNHIEDILDYSIYRVR